MKPIKNQVDTYIWQEVDNGTSDIPQKIFDIIRIRIPFHSMTVQVQEELKDETY